MPKFKILRGKHEESVLETAIDPNTGEPVLDDSGEPLKALVPYRYRRGQIVESRTNLLRFNRAGCRKFQRISDDTPPSQVLKSDAPLVADIPSADERETDQEVETHDAPDDVFSEMSMEDLRQLAHEKEIDTKGARSKKALADVLRQYADAE